MVVLLAALLIALNALWDAYGLMTGQMRPSTVSLFVNVVATIFVIAVLNEVARRFLYRALPSDTLLFLTVSLSVASAVFGLTYFNLCFPLLPIPFGLLGKGTIGISPSCPTCRSCPSFGTKTLCAAFTRAWRLLSDGMF